MVGAEVGLSMPPAAAIASSLSAAVASGHGFEDISAHPAFYRDAMAQNKA